MIAYRWLSFKKCLNNLPKTDNKLSDTKEEVANYNSWTTVIWCRVSLSIVRACESWFSRRKPNDRRTMRSIAFILAAFLTLGIGDGLEWRGGVIDTILSLMLESNQVRWDYISWRIVRVMYKAKTTWSKLQNWLLKLRRRAHLVSFI